MVSEGVARRFDRAVEVSSGILVAQATKAQTVIVNSSARFSWMAMRASQSASAALARGGQGEARKEPGSGEASSGEQRIEPPALTGLSHGTAVYGPVRTVVWEG